MPAGIDTCTTSPLSGATYSVSTVLLDGRQSLPATVSITDGKQAQSIWLSPLPDRPYSHVPFVVTAVASSGASVAITASGGCTGTGANQRLSDHERALAPAPSQRNRRAMAISKPCR